MSICTYLRASSKFCLFYSDEKEQLGSSIQHCLSAGCNHSSGHSAKSRTLQPPVPSKVRHVILRGVQAVAFIVQKGWGCFKAKNMLLFFRARGRCELDPRHDSAGGCTSFIFCCPRDNKVSRVLPREKNCCGLCAVGALFAYLSRHGVFMQPSQAIFGTVVAAGYTD